MLAIASDGCWIKSGMTVAKLFPFIKKCFKLHPMKLLSAIFALVILIPVLAFALSNKQPVDVTIWPLQTTLSLPLYLIGLAPLLCGLIIGGIWGWLCGVPHRFRARKLHKELGALKATTASQPAPPKNFWNHK